MLIHPPVRLRREVLGISGICMNDQVRRLSEYDKGTDSDANRSYVIIVPTSDCREQMKAVR